MWRLCWSQSFHLANKPVVAAAAATPEPSGPILPSPLKDDFVRGVVDKTLHQLEQAVEPFLSTKPVEQKLSNQMQSAIEEFAEALLPFHKELNDEEWQEMISRVPIVLRHPYGKSRPEFAEVITAFERWLGFRQGSLHLYGLASNSFVIHLVSAAEFKLDTVGIHMNAIPSDVKYNWVIVYRTRTDEPEIPLGVTFDVPVVHALNRVNRKITLAGLSLTRNRLLGDLRVDRENPFNHEVAQELAKEWEKVAPPILSIFPKVVPFEHQDLVTTSGPQPWSVLAKLIPIQAHCLEKNDDTNVVLGTIEEWLGFKLDTIQLLQNTDNWKKGALLLILVSLDSPLLDVEPKLTNVLLTAIKVGVSRAVVLYHATDAKKLHAENWQDKIVPFHGANVAIPSGEILLNRVKGDDLEIDASNSTNDKCYKKLVQQIKEAVQLRVSRPTKTAQPKHLTVVCASLTDKKEFHSLVTQVFDLIAPYDTTLNLYLPKNLPSGSFVLTNVAHLPTKAWDMDLSVQLVGFPDHITEIHMLVFSPSGTKGIPSRQTRTMQQADGKMRTFYVYPIITKMGEVDGQNTVVVDGSAQDTKDSINDLKQAVKKAGARYEVPAK